VVPESLQRLRGKIGSKECEEGKIFIESNGYCTLAGIGLEDGKAASALAAVASILPQSTASWCSSRPTPGTTRDGRNLLLSAGIQGERRHLLPRQSWIMIGETRLGHGDLAHDYYSRINPRRARRSATCIAASLMSTHR